MMNVACFDRERKRVVNRNKDNLGNLSSYILKNKLVCVNRGSLHIFSKLYAL